MVTLRSMKDLGEAVTAKDAWLVRGIVVRVVAGPVAASHVVVSADSSFVSRARNCRSDARGVGCEAL
jgi:hypothetical protein